MWLNSGISGRADRTSNTYTKVDRLTGRVYAVTLRNPRTGKDFNNAQITQNNKFGAISMGVGAVVCLACCIIANLVITPLYMGAPVQTVVDMIVPALLPFNVAKIAINCAVTAAVYKPVTKALGN